MPIDASIPLQGQGSQVDIANPIMRAMEMQGAQAQVQKNQLLARMGQVKLSEAQGMSQLMAHPELFTDPKTGQPNYDKLEALVVQVAPNTGEAFLNRMRQTQQMQQDYKLKAAASAGAAYAAIFHNPSAENVKAVIARTKALYGDTPQGQQIEQQLMRATTDDERKKLAAELASGSEVGQAALKVFSPEYEIRDQGGFNVGFQKNANAGPVGADPSTVVGKTATPGEVLSNTATLRGQDINAETTRRGQDVAADTARRGQDFSIDPKLQGAKSQAEHVGTDLATQYNNVAGAASIATQTLPLINEAKTLVDKAYTSGGGKKIVDVANFFGRGGEGVEATNKLRGLLNNLVAINRSGVQGLGRLGGAFTKHQIELENFATGNQPMSAESLKGILDDQGNRYQRLLKVPGMLQEYTGGDPSKFDLGFYDKYAPQIMADPSAALGQGSQLPADIDALVKKHLGQ